MKEITKIHQQAIAKIRAFVRDTPGMSKSGLAVRAKLSKNALSDMDSARWQPTAETLDKLLAFIEQHEARRKPRPSRRPAGAVYA